MDSIHISRLLRKLSPELRLEAETWALQKSNELVDQVLSNATRERVGSVAQTIVIPPSTVVVEPVVVVVEPVVVPSIPQTGHVPQVDAENSWQGWSLFGSWGGSGHSQSADSKIHSHLSDLVLDTIKKDLGIQEEASAMETTAEAEVAASPNLVYSIGAIETETVGELKDRIETTFDEPIQDNVSPEEPAQENTDNTQNPPYVNEIPTIDADERNISGVELEPAVNGTKPELGVPNAPESMGSNLPPRLSLNPHAQVQWNTDALYLLGNERLLSQLPGLAPGSTPWSQIKEIAGQNSNFHEKIKEKTGSAGAVKVITALLSLVYAWTLWKKLRERLRNRYITISNETKERLLKGSIEPSVHTKKTLIGIARQKAGNGNVVVTLPNIRDDGEMDPVEILVPSGTADDERPNTQIVSAYAILHNIPEAFAVDIKWANALRELLYPYTMSHGYIPQDALDLVGKISEAWRYYSSEFRSSHIVDFAIFFMVLPPDTAHTIMREMHEAETMNEFYTMYLDEEETDIFSDNEFHEIFSKVLESIKNVERITYAHLDYRAVDTGDESSDFSSSDVKVPRSDVWRIYKSEYCARRFNESTDMWLEATREVSQKIIEKYKNRVDEHVSKVFDLRGESSAKKWVDSIQGMMCTHDGEQLIASPWTSYYDPNNEGAAAYLVSVPSNADFLKRQIENREDNDLLKTLPQKIQWWTSISSQGVLADDTLSLVIKLTALNSVVALLNTDRQDIQLSDAVGDQDMDIKARALHIISQTKQPLLSIIYSNKIKNGRSGPLPHAESSQAAVDRIRGHDGILHAIMLNNYYRVSSKFVLSINSDIALRTHTSNAMYDTHIKNSYNMLEVIRRHYQSTTSLELKKYTPVIKSWIRLSETKTEDVDEFKEEEDPMAKIRKMREARESEEQEYQDRVNDYEFATQTSTLLFRLQEIHRTRIADTLTFVTSKQTRENVLLRKLMCIIELGFSSLFRKPRSKEDEKTPLQSRTEMRPLSIGALLNAEAGDLFMSYVLFNCAVPFNVRTSVHHLLSYISGQRKAPSIIRQVLETRITELDNDIIVQTEALPDMSDEIVQGLSSDITSEEHCNMYLVWKRDVFQDFVEDKYDEELLPMHTHLWMMHAIDLAHRLVHEKIELDKYGEISTQLENLVDTAMHRLKTSDAVDSKYDMTVLTQALKSLKEELQTAQNRKENEFATKSDFKSLSDQIQVVMAQIKDLNGSSAVNKIDLTDFVKKSDIADFVKKDDIKRLDEKIEEKMNTIMSMLNTRSTPAPERPPASVPRAEPGMDSDTEEFIKLLNAI